MRLLLLNKGLVPYAQALALQTRLAAAVRDQSASSSSSGDVLLLLQHPPTYTAGRRLHSNGTDAATATRLARETGAEVHEVLRGGQMTFHGPGQLVGYPIMNLQRAKMGVRDYVARLERVLINTCGAFGVESRTTENTGVWVEDRKIAALGIHVSRHVTMHGFALNCNTDLSWFTKIDPCGLGHLGVTSLTRELGRTVTCDDVAPALISSFEEEFGVELIREDYDG